MNDENKGQNFNEFLVEEGIAEEVTEAAVANIAIRAEIESQKYGIKVTAADFNGESFDGAPLVPVGITEEVFGSLLANDQITIKKFSNTDYALWEVKVKQGGILIAGPGDFITIDENQGLDVLMDPGSSYN